MPIKKTGDSQGDNESKPKENRAPYNQQWNDVLAAISWYVHSPWISTLVLPFIALFLGPFMAKCFDISSIKGIALCTAIALTIFIWSVALTIWFWPTKNNSADLASSTREPTPTPTALSKSTTPNKMDTPAPTPIVQNTTITTGNINGGQMY